MSARNQSEQERAREALMLRMIEAVERMFDDDGDDDDDFMDDIKDLE
jgi:hypothetical protein